MAGSKSSDLGAAPGDLAAVIPLRTADRTRSQQREDEDPGDHKRVHPKADRLRTVMAGALAKAKRNEVAERMKAKLEKRPDNTANRGTVQADTGLPGCRCRDDRPVPRRLRKWLRTIG